LAYDPDCLHVADPVVRKVIGIFLRAYIGHDVVASSFNEITYLAVNPDVDAAVRAGEFESGYEHWMTCGKVEGSKTR
jgi:hypothetical protein